MWQVLLAAAVAGSTGFIAKRFFTPAYSDNPTKSQDRTVECAKDFNHTSEPLKPVNNANLLPTISGNPVGLSDFHECEIENTTEKEDGVFRFSSPGSEKGDGCKCSRKKLGLGCRGSKKGVNVGQKLNRGSGGGEIQLEQKKAAKRFHVCLNRRKAVKNVAGKDSSCSSKDSSLFGWGLGFGIMCMMSAGRADLSKLNKLVDEATAVVEELKPELNKRKSVGDQQIFNAADKAVLNSKKIRGNHTPSVLDKSYSSPRDPNIDVLTLPLGDNIECGSSGLTEEPDRRNTEMDQLEAELESELKKLHRCNKEDPSDEDMNLNLKMDDSNYGFPETNLYRDSTQYHGVLASELHQRLSKLLIEQQENQIIELESELNLAQSKLDEKDAELQALKDCVRRLTEFSLSTVSDEENEPHFGQDKRCRLNGSQQIENRSKHSAVGMKRPIDPV